jgi:hypothetical protein
MRADPVRSGAAGALSSRHDATRERGSVTVTCPAAGAHTIGDGLTALDTRSRRWEPNGFERAFRKVLTVDGSGKPSAFISYLPGQFSSGHALPTRHLHHRIHEFSFALGGEYPIWQYESAGTSRGVLTILKPGYFFSRLPGSVHGREPGPISDVGFTSLTWRDRTGNWMFEPDFATESAFVAYGDDWDSAPDAADRQADGDGTVLRWSDLTVLDTRAMRWAEDGEGALRKRLWAEPIVALVHVGAGVTHTLDDDVDNAFALEGALEVLGHLVPQASLLKRERGTPCALAAGPAGTTMLTWRDP